MNNFLAAIEPFIQSSWLTKILVAIAIIIVTAIVAHVVRVFMRRILRSRKDEKALPASSIFINVARGVVWVLGVCVMLSTCFNIDVSAAIAALGVTGIAVSLGFQDTISNLIGGLQVSLMRIVEPGDNIRVGTDSGVVEDVSWRHTTIRNISGDEILIPNSTINTTALVHLPPVSKVKLPVVVDTAGEQLDEVAAHIESAAKEAVSALCELSEDPKLIFNEIIFGGYKGMLVFVVADATKVVDASNAAIRAIGPFMRAPIE